MKSRRAITVFSGRNQDGFAERSISSWRELHHRNIVHSEIRQVSQQNGFSSSIKVQGTWTRAIECFVKYTIVYWIRGASLVQSLVQSLAEIFFPVDLDTCGTFIKRSGHLDWFWKKALYQFCSVLFWGVGERDTFSWFHKQTNQPTNERNKN